MRRVFGSLGLTSMLLAACTISGGDVAGAPEDQGIPGAPTEPAPTGNKWEGAEVDDACGKTTLAWFLVDEVCGGTDDPGYLDAFHAPMFRDGVRAGDFLFTVDATHLWVLDVSDPANIERVALVAGLGQPIAVELDGTRLLVAGGSEGLVLVDVSSPAEPTKHAQVGLPGPALDVFIDGATAYVAMGAAGIGVIDLGAEAPVLVGTLEVPGFAASVQVREDLAYVAACDGLAVVDVQSDDVLSMTWIENAYRNERLVAPAKGVALAGDVAFVAAGRFGAVAIDVSDPAAPAVIGNCTVEDDLSFYASGVREAGGRLFIAGGEWGILPVDLVDPLLACKSMTVPELPPDPTETGGECSHDPPWEVVPWQDLWSPPPPGQDPIQTLPYGEVVYAFGDARRIGLRAVDVREAFGAGLAKIGRYDEPRLLTGIAAHGDRVLLIGPAGGIFTRDDGALLAASDETQPPAAGTVAGAFLEDGRWVVATADETLVVQGEAAGVAVGAPVWPNGIATRGDDVVVPLGGGARVFDIGEGTVSTLSGKEDAKLPPSLIAADSGIVLASPEWTRAVRLDGAGAEELAPHGVFSGEEIMNANLWRKGLPRRVVASAPAGIVEVATLGTRAGLTLHGADGAARSVTLPAGTYTGGAATAKRIYLVTADRNVYRSQLVTVAIGDDGVEVARVEAFTGVASGVAVSGDRLYVADADRGVRVYARSDASTELLGTVDPEVSP